MIMVLFIGTRSFSKLSVVVFHLILQKSQIKGDETMKNTSVACTSITRQTNTVMLINQSRVIMMSHKSGILYPQPCIIA